VEQQQELWEETGERYQYSVADGYHMLREQQGKEGCKRSRERGRAPGGDNEENMAVVVE
jgi:hypothetical protein